MGRSGNQQAGAGAALLERSPAAADMLLAPENNKHIKGMRDETALKALMKKGVPYEEAIEQVEVIDTPLTKDDLTWVMQRVLPELQRNRRRFRILSDKEQKDLVRIAKQVTYLMETGQLDREFGQPVKSAIWEIVVAMHQGIARDRMKSYIGRPGFSAEDYLQAAYAEVPKALADFDLTLGRKFSSYLGIKYWGGMTNHAREMSGTISAGSTYDNIVQNVRYAINEIDSYGYIKQLDDARRSLAAEGQIELDDELATRIAELTGIESDLVEAYVEAKRLKRDTLVSMVAARVTKKRSKKGNDDTSDERRPLDYKEAQHIVMMVTGGVSSLDRSFGGNDEEGGSLADVLAADEMTIEEKIINEESEEEIWQLIEGAESLHGMSKVEEFVLVRRANFDGDDDVPEKAFYQFGFQDKQNPQKFYAVHESAAKELRARHENIEIEIMKVSDMQKAMRDGKVDPLALTGEAAQLMDMLGTVVTKSKVQQLEAKARKRLRDALESTPQALRHISQYNNIVENSDGVREVVRRELLNRVSEAGGSATSGDLTSADNLSEIITRAEASDIVRLGKRFGILTSGGSVVTDEIRDWTPPAQPQTKKHSKETQQRSETKSPAKPTTVSAAKVKNLDASLFQALREANSHDKRMLIVAEANVRNGKDGTDIKEMDAYYEALGLDKPAKWQDVASNARGSVKSQGRGVYAPVKHEPVVAAVAKVGTKNPKAFEKDEIVARLKKSGVTSAVKGLAIVIAAAAESGKATITRQEIEEKLREVDLQGYLKSHGVTWNGDPGYLISNSSKKSYNYLTQLEEGGRKVTGVYVPTAKAVDEAKKLLKA